MKNDQTTKRRAEVIGSVVLLLLLSLLFSGWLWAMLRLWDGILNR